MPAGNPAWKKGQSANPAGRPKSSQNIITSANAHNFTREIMIESQPLFSEVVKNILIKAGLGDKFYENLVTRDLAKYFLVQPKIDVAVTQESGINEELAGLMRDAPKDKILKFRDRLKSLYEEFKKDRIE